MYDILLTRQAERDLKRLSADTFRRILPHIQHLAKTPRPTGCRKLAGATRDYRLRVGEYRILYEVDDTSQIVRVMRVRRRRDAYR